MFTLGTTPLAEIIAQNNYFYSPETAFLILVLKFGLFRSNANLRTALRKVVREAASTTCS